jgi:hypothetical protein
MTTSGTYSFSVNRDQIIRMAMMFGGKLGDTENPSAQETSDCAFVLNMMTKQWMGKADFAPGLKTWTRRRGYLFLSGTTGQYSVGPTAPGWTTAFVNPLTTASALSGASAVVVANTAGIASGYSIGVELVTGTLQWTTVANVVGFTVNLNAPLAAAVSTGAEVYAYQTAAQQPIKIEAAVLRDAQNNDAPLKIMEQPDYDFLSSKTNTTNISDPTAIYYEFQLGNSYLYTDVAAAQDVSKYIVLTYQEPIQDFNNPLDTPEYPSEWFLALCWGLAIQIAPMFRFAVTAEMKNNFDTALAIAQHKDPERVTMFFQPGEDGS